MPVHKKADRNKRIAAAVLYNFGTGGGASKLERLSLASFFSVLYIVVRPVVTLNIKLDD
jgi:hypothetical protein